jgi:hypothetical protein
LGVEVGDFGVDGLADHFALAGVDEFAHFCVCFFRLAYGFSLSLF